MVQEGFFSRCFFSTLCDVFDVDGLEVIVVDFEDQWQFYPLFYLWLRIQKLVYLLI